MENLIFRGLVDCAFHDITSSSHILCNAQKQQVLLIKPEDVCNGFKCTPQFQISNVYCLAAPHTDMDAIVSPQEAPNTSQLTMQYN